MTISEKNRKLILIMLAVIMVCAAFVMGLMIKSCTGEQASINASADKTAEYRADVDPDAESPDNNSSVGKNDSKSRGIRIPGYPSIRIPCDTTEIKTSLLNPEGNPCYFVFELVLSDTDEVLYRSKQVPPGKAINNITLSRPLKKGEYDAVIKISTFSLENGGAMNGANVRTKLIVN